MDVSLNPDAPMILGDIAMMQRVLENLLENGLRHTPAGGTVNLAAKTSEKGVQLQVRDSGSGIDAADLPYIFHRFYRGDRSRQQNGEAGLGLAIAKSIVEAHGGSITAESILGAGTIFTITLPQDR